MLPRDQRAHLDAGLGARADLELAHAGSQTLDQGIGGSLANGDRHRDRHAALAGRAVGSTHERIHRHVEVGIGHDHHVVLGPAQGLDAFPVCRARPVDVLGHGRGAHEADGGDVGMSKDGVDGFLAPVDHVDHAWGHVRLHHQLGER
jgi:hypothetical protein